MGQQYSAHADGTAAVTSSQHASISSHITSSESKIKTDSADTRSSAAWKNSINTVMSSGRGESEMAEISSLKSRSDLEVSRMSIRAAIDTVIENCLSSNNDYSPQADNKTDDDFPASDCSNEEVSGDMKNEFVSSRSRSSDSPKDDSNKHVKTAESESCNQLETCYTSNDCYSCVEVTDAEEVQVEKENSDNVKDRTGNCDGLNHQSGQKQEIGQKPRISEQSLENVKNTAFAQPRASTEKQTFSAYLQERLKTVDVEKREELTQLAMNKDIQSHGQMLMWEVAKKSPDTCDPGNQSSALKSHFTASGPVKLQTVIDRVLDNSIRNENQSPGNRTGDSTTSDHALSSASGLQSLSETTLKDKLESSENISAPGKKASLCFKDHIEKVLLESFLSFEEDERREALKAEAENNKPPNVGKINSGVNTCTPETHQQNHSNGDVNSSSVHMDGLNSNKMITSKSAGDRDKQQNTNKDGTISVQDIVDQVISQTEMISKLLTPSTRDTSKLTSSSGQTDIAVSSSSTFSQANPRLLDHSSTQNRALVEAQRHAVLKEHQCSTNMGRKRGRPRLGSPVNSAAKSAHESGKSGYPDVRSSHMASHVNEHPHIISMNHHQFGAAGGITSMMAAKNVASPTSVMIHQTHHMRQKSPSPSSVKKCLTGSAVSGYQLSPHDHHHHHQHLPSHVHHQQNQTRTHDSIQVPNSNAPPPLILADKVKNSMPGSNRLMPVYHIPSQSCSCNSCRIFFSQMKHHAHATQLQHHPHTAQHQPHTAQHQPHTAQHQPHTTQHQTHTTQHQTHTTQHQPHTTQHQPHTTQHQPHTTQHQTHTTQHQPHTTQHQPHTTQHQPHTTQHQPHTTQHQPHTTQHQHHPFPKQTNTAELDQRPSFHHSSPATTHTDSSAFYLLPVSTSSESPSSVVPVQTQAPQTSRSAFTAGHRQRRDMALTSREPVSDGVNPRSYLQDYYHHPSHGQTSQTHLVKPAFIDTRFSETEQVIHVDQLTHAEDSFQRMTNDSSPHLGVVERPKLEVPMHQNDDHPLDLSIKPCPARSQDTKTNFNSGSDPARESSELSVKNSHANMRWSSSDHNPGVQGHYVEHEQQGAPSGHHLQRLENSVDRFLSHQRPEAQFPLSSPYSHHPQLHQHRPKIVQLSPTHQTPPEVWGGQLQHYSQPENRYSEPPSRDQQNSIHSHQSEVSYTHQTISYVGQMPPVSQPHCHQSKTESLEERHRYPSLMSQQNFPKNMITAQQVQQSDHSAQNLSQLSRNVSPASFHLHHRLGPESESKTSPATDSSYASSPCPQSSPSPDDGQKLNVCKHEPIQNIIGKHPPSDILYLICRLCRQTYGSPYCFRKHFRNQHGFEPKADHTIIQTISATKTAMAHSGSSDVAVAYTVSLDASVAHTESSDATMAHTGSSDATMTPKGSSNATLAHRESFDSTGILFRSVQVEKLPSDDLNQHSQSIKSPAAGTASAMSSQQLLNPVPFEETKLGIKKENFGMTKYLECPECGQTFQLNDFGSYKRHCRQHSLHRSSGPFACHECERSFSEPAHLQEHQTTHSSFTPSVCAVCHTFFSSATYLAEHLQAAHGITSGNESKQSLTSADQSSEPPALTDMSKLKRSSSFPDWSVMGSPPSLRQAVGASASSHSATPSPSGHGTALLSEPQVLIKSASVSPSVSASHTLPIVKRPRYNQPSENAYMLTVHTPKGLEVQKLPADAIVTTASPDSSFDEAKLFLDVPQGGSTFQKDRQEITQGSNNQGEGTCQMPDNKSSSIMKLARLNDNISNVRYDNKDETESNCSSVGSGSVSLNSSRAPSPAVNEEETYYKHKKYSLHRKRTNISEPGSEPVAKSPKVDGSNVSVSSTGNSGVTIQDCESSSPRLENSSQSWRISAENKIENDKMTDSQKQEQGDNCVQSKGNKSDLSTGSNKSRDSFQRNGSGEGGGQFKWDRQTRSQAGKIVSQ